MMMRWLILACAALLAAWTASLHAQPAPACAALPDLGRYPADRQAIEYGRLVDYATAAREDGADRARDIADLLLPDARGEFAAYLRVALTPEQIGELWSFLVPRAGPVPASDPAVRLGGWRYLRQSGADIEYNRVDAPDFVTRRRDRAWQYLQHHRYGRALMAATTLFARTRPATAGGTAPAC